MSVRPRWVLVGPRRGAAGDAPDPPSTPAPSGAELSTPAGPASEQPPDTPRAPAPEPFPVQAFPPDVADGVWTDPSDLETQLLVRWRDERRRLTVVPAGGPAFTAQLLGAGRDVLYVADAQGQARLLYRWAIRELIPLED